MGAHWIISKKGRGIGARCSECGRDVGVVWAEDEKVEFSFCPHCGEPMDRKHPEIEEQQEEEEEPGTVAGKAIDDLVKRSLWESPYYVYPTDDTEKESREWRWGSIPPFPVMTDKDFDSWKGFLNRITKLKQK